MALLLDRLAEAERALRRTGLRKAALPAVSKRDLGRRPFEVLKLERKDHVLEVFVFNDRTVSVSVRTVSVMPTALFLLAVKGGPAWCVHRDGQYVDRCSEMLFTLWEELPRRRIADSGLFSVHNGRRALTIMLRAFAALPES